MLTEHCYPELKRQEKTTETKTQKWTMLDGHMIESFRSQRESYIENVYTLLHKIFPSFRAKACLSWRGQENRLITMVLICPAGSTMSKYLMPRNRYELQACYAT